MKVRRRKRCRNKMHRRGGDYALSIISINHTILYMHLKKVFVLVVIIFSLGNASAQFIDNFNGTGTPKGWTFNTGDGRATMDFKQHNGMASIYVDATNDKLG